MKFNENNLESFLNDEFKHDEIENHIQNCVKCNLFIEESIKVNNVLSSFQQIKIDKTFLDSLQAIPLNNTKKKYIWSLFPEKLILTTVSIILAVFIGSIFSFTVVNALQIDDVDPLEEISISYFFENNDIN
jgi:ribulose 1,5-bisphosphate carboxylase large subunit-like protein